MTTEVALDIDDERVKEMGKLYVKALENEEENIKTQCQTNHCVLFDSLTPCGDKASENEQEKYQPKHCALLDPLTPCGDTVFHIAAYMGSINLLRDLFEKVALIARKREVFTMKNSHGNTLLHEVVTSNKFKAVKFLVDEIAKEGRARMLRDRNNLGETVLYRAAAFGNKATVEYLVNEVEHPKGNLKDDHLTRTSDGLSILHIAIMNEKFETAIWLLNKDPKLATKKYSEKTCLHILASMPTAFRSSSSIMYGLEIIYRYIPDNLVYRDETEQDVPSQSDIPDNLVYRDETEQDASSQSCRRRCLTMIKNICLCKYNDLWSYLAEKCNVIKEIGETKKKHRFAVDLAKMLVKMDSCSWREHYNEEGHNKIVCFSGDHKKGDKKTGEASSQAGCDGNAATIKPLPDTPLLIAARTGIKEIVDEIIKVYPQALEHVTGTGQNILHVAILHRNQIFDAIEPPPDTPLIIAARTGIMEIVDEIIKEYPQALEHVTRSGQNILHVAILHRSHIIFRYIKSKKKAVLPRLVLGIDNEGDTILHKAASTKYYSGGTTSTAALQLQEELRWFRKVEKMVPAHYTILTNKKDRTAKQLLKDEHKEQLKEAQGWVKNTSQSCSTVAVLVATVLFAAAFSVPGGFIGYDDAKNATASPPTGAISPPTGAVSPPTGAVDVTPGRAVLENEPLYSFFTVMDVAGLASSLTSVVLFLSVLTSSLDLEEFHHQIPSKLSAGFLFLSFAIATTLLSFTAAIMLTFHLESKWTTTLTYAAAFLPVSIYAIVQFGLYLEYLKSALIGIFRVLKVLLPGDRTLHIFKRYISI